jgi:hypothetical protein
MIDKILQHDKLKHFFFGTLWAFLLTWLGVDPLLVVFLSFGLGIVKEIVDYFIGGKQELLDVLYTTLPALLLFLIFI